eukprot:GHVO01007086.1.p1 GENE.GHVO01007086.1~~GHVO01007086.1.p1  ORF type:complete len:203 (-),score=14.52 GHVO01007086.1:88-696(-)
MMASQAPKHDFAPSWLKIPDQEKPGGPKSSEDRGPKGRDDYYYRQHPDICGPLSRQRSFENYGDDRRGYTPNGSKLRHHSVEDEYTNYNGYGCYNGYHQADKYGAPYRSQPSLYRDKQRFPVNGSYYDGHTYDHYGDANYGQRNRRPEQRPRENGHRDEGKDLQEEEFPSLNGGDGSESKKSAKQWRVGRSAQDIRPYQEQQ